MKTALSIRQKLEKDIQKRKIQGVSSMTFSFKIPFFLGFSLPTEQFPSCHERSCIIHTGTLLNYTEDIYNMGPHCKNTSQKSNKYTDTIPFQRSYFQEQKTLQQTTSKCPFLTYTSLVLVFLRNFYHSSKSK